MTSHSQCLWPVPSYLG
ncbi:Spike glycoprotein [Labeo rohita]|uniref:Spike glycoprotein n=1 Tax=Labeo rohita TaxID=84645 RepID=A0ABQ8M3I4_LABRO|nr:Spike glycoprotein [Labeo rohita]